MGEEGIKLVVNNKKACFDYSIDEKYEAGIELFSTEVKLIRMGKCSVKESFVKMDWGETYVCDMHASPYEKSNILDKDPLRVHKFLLHKYEILKIGGKIKEKDYTLVPLRVYFKGSLVKVGIGLARGRENYNKRVDTTKKDRRRELEKDLRVRDLYQGKWKVPCDVDMRRYLEFMKGVEGLKSTLRIAWIATGRQESTAEHSWRLALGAAVLCCEPPELDREKMMPVCLVHDPGELYTSDILTALRPDEGEKHRQGQLDVSRTTKAVSGPCAKEIMVSCKEYNQGQTPGARFVRTMDEAETIIQHSQGVNPPDFDYEFNPFYGMECFQENERLKKLGALTDEKASEAQHRSLQYG